jgi:hypothetical protein
MTTTQEKQDQFGEYHFEDWVPEPIREQIVRFWGIWGRNYESWLENGRLDQAECSHHGPNPNGFKNPPLGARVIYMVKDYDAQKRAGRSERLYRSVEGRYIHAWNNMGRLVLDDGTYIVVSSCDIWVRVWQEGEEKSI